MTVLDQWMRLNGWTNRKMSHKTGYSEKTIQRARQGKGGHYDTMMTLSQATGIPLDQIQQPIKSHHKVAVS